MAENESMNRFLEDNYGSIYKTTGGGKLDFMGVNVHEFVKGLLGNRVFDLYLKYYGLKLLNTATLVPLALILSVDYMKDILTNKQTGGALDQEIPILDNELVGNYLKLMGLTVLDLTPSTLLPLGAAMIIYDLVNINKDNMKQSGGSRYITGADIPQGIVQNVGYSLRGLEAPEPLLDTYYKSPEFNDHLMTQCSNGSCGVDMTSGEMPDVLSEVDGFPDFGIDDQTVPDKIYESNFEPVDDSMAKSMAGGGKNRKRTNKLSLKQIQKLNCNINKTLKNNKNDKQKIFAKTVSYYQGKCNKKPQINQTGKGSDWISSQYSMGPVNYANQDPSHFKMFNKSVPVPDMNSYGASRIIPTDLKLDLPLYAQSACQEGLSTNKYGGGGLEPHELFKANEPDYSVPGQNFDSFSNTSVQNGIQRAGYYKNENQEEDNEDQDNEDQDNEDQDNEDQDNEDQDDENDLDDISQMDKIRDPVSKKWLSVHSNEGRAVIQKYLEFLNGGKKLCKNGPNEGSYLC